MKGITKYIAIAMLVVLTFVTSISQANADSVKQSQANSAKQAAQEAIQDTGAKEIFGKNQNGEELIDKAQSEASKKLTKLAQDAEEGKPIPESQKNFLDNLRGN